MLAVCAASPVVRFPSQRGEVGRTETSGPTAYPAAKANRDRSMPLKREWPEDVYGQVTQDPRAKVTARLPEPQPPVLQAHGPCSQRLVQGHPDSASKRPAREPSTGWTERNDRSQGGERGTYGALGRLTTRECRIAYGSRELRRRSARSSRGRDAPPGSWGEPSAGRRGTGVCGRGAGR